MPAQLQSKFPRQHLRRAVNCWNSIRIHSETNCSLNSPSVHSKHFWRCDWHMKRTSMINRC